MRLCPLGHSRFIFKAKTTERKVALKKERFRMNETEKTAWVDEENEIVSFHAIDNGEMVMKTENLFWEFLFGLTSAGYRGM